MAATRFRALIGHIEMLSGALCDRQRSDRQLLDDFSTRRDEPAFAELVARHGPMVLRVCRRMLHHQEDAEDAFQATFLVLAQCLGSIRQRESLANWLHGVAYRTAMKAKRSAARRRNHEVALRERTPPAPPSPTWDDVQAVLDEEIQRLPAVFRSAFVLCVLEGKTLATAAAELQCKEGTVASRLSRARQRLQQQLARRGVKLMALLAALCVAQSGKAALPRVLAQTTVRSGIAVASAGTAAGLISPQVAELATGVTREMVIKKTRIATILLLAVSLIAAAGVLTHQMLEADEKTTAQPAKPTAEPGPAAPETIEVSGRVLDPNGKPVARARLYQPHWLTEKADAESEMRALGTTDADGRFRVTLTRPGRSSRPIARGDRIVGGGGGGMVSLSTLPQPTGADRQPLAILAAAEGFGLNWTELPRDKEPGEVTVRLVKDQHVNGRLINTEGQPVVGVTVAVKGVGGSVDDVVHALDPSVRVPESTRTLAARLNNVLHVTATDKEGRFEITGVGIDRFALLGVNSETSVLPNIFVATRADFDPKNLQRHPRPGQAQLFGPTFECIVLPGRPVEGLVREAVSGKPVVGAEVLGHAARQTARAVTDDKGHYKLVGLPKTATYRFQVTPANGAPLLARTAEATDRPGLERVTCDIDLLRGVLVTGRVTDKGTGKGVECQVHCALLPDNPLAGKLRELQALLPTTSTDSDGRFRVVTLPGPNLLVVLAGANPMNGVHVHTYKSAQLDEADRKIVKLDETMRGIVVAGGRAVNLRTVNAVKVLDLEEGAAAVTANLTLDPGQTMTIRLQDPDGKPLRGALAAGVADMPHAVVPLEDDTCRVFALDPERPRQVAFLHPEKKLFAIVTVRGDEKESRAVRLVAPAVVTGRLLDADGKPVAGASIHPRYAETAVQMLVSGGRAPGVLKTDKDGLFRLEGVAPGIKVRLSYRRDREEWIEDKDTDRGSYKSGEIVNLGDVRVKPRPRPE